MTKKKTVIHHGIPNPLHLWSIEFGPFKINVEDPNAEFVQELKASVDGATEIEPGVFRFEQNVSFSTRPPVATLTDGKVDTFIGFNSPVDGEVRQCEFLGEFYGGDDLWGVTDTTPDLVERSSAVRAVANAIRQEAEKYQSPEQYYVRGDARHR